MLRNVRIWQLLGLSSPIILSSSEPGSLPLFRGADPYDIHVESGELGLHGDFAGAGSFSCVLRHLVAVRLGESTLHLPRRHFRQCVPSISHPSPSTTHPIKRKPSCGVRLGHLGICASLADRHEQRYIVRVSTMSTGPILTKLVSAILVAIFIRGLGGGRHRAVRSSQSTLSIPRVRVRRACRVCAVPANA